MTLRYIFHFNLFIVLFFAQVCAQKAKNTSLKNRPIEQLYSNVKPLKYGSMPQYFIEAHQSGCYYEVYINGILNDTRYINAGTMNNAIPINDNILKSGPQKVTIKLFPLGEIDGKVYTTLTERTRFTLEIFKRDKATPWEGLDYDVVHHYFAPTTTGEEARPFAHANEPMYEETFTFNAEVPYELTGWSDSQVIEGQEGIEQEVLDFYKEYADVIRNQDEDKWAEMVKTREQEYLRSVYYNDKSKEGFKKRVAYFTNTFDNEFIEKMPLDKYEITFSANGKIVTLKSLDYPGESAFSFKENRNRHNGERDKYIASHYIFLHKPKGSNKLEIIR
ncbi:hypothetical protein Q4603_21805 [Zobellia galactanivorans]|uniref:hypothetical protein n=1 Tax=Zobellia galactanivorans (strain DSM 12802 / CCUG 47099 / CIP 106680 / NCIMB 13871 / Dsij) TaxID=63186 RepID=UPI0026E3325D|nr:hypothetical protein [Zobellia galactanivorans]MDO6811267.1 hypothetical protein [Zobellia galactanivorans]